MAGVEVRVEGLSKSFGHANIWSDVTHTLPPGEVSVLLPSSTGKSAFLKTLIGLIKPEKGAIIIDDVDLVRCSERGQRRVVRLHRGRRRRLPWAQPRRPGPRASATR